MLTTDFAIVTSADSATCQQEPSLTEWQPLQCPTPSCSSTLGSRNIRLITAEEQAEDASNEHESNGSSGLRLAETWRLDKYAVEFIDRDERYVLVSALIPYLGLTLVYFSCFRLRCPLDPFHVTSTRFFPWKCWNARSRWASESSDWQTR